ncbi:MAG: hypothetical protein ACQEXC_08395 [Pseudomonadota bacterium]
MFFRRKRKKGEKNLSGVVEKVNDTGYVFVDINNDLGEAAEEIMSSSPMIQMAYGYARRTAVAALYVQGLVNKETYDHVISIFKSLQIKTGHSVEFQESAFAEAAEYMIGYHHLITSFMAKMIVSVAENYEIPSGQLDDAQLFKEVLDTAHNEQEARHVSFGHEHGGPRLIEYVDQVNSSHLGPFANMLEDVKTAASQSDILRTPLLSAAVGYSMELAVAALWVAGGVHHKIIEDTIEGIYVFKADIGSDHELHSEALAQAVELANVYTPGTTVKHIEVIVGMVKDLERFRHEGEPVLETSEVLLRAERVAAV